MANVFRGVLDFTVRGANTVQRIERLFERLGMRVDLVYDSFRDGANTVERASARIHGLKEREIEQLEELIRLEHRLSEERLAPANRGRAYMQPTFGRAALPQGRMGTLTRDANGNVVDTEAERRRQERVANARARLERSVDAMWNNLLDQRSERERREDEARQQWRLRFQEELAQFDEQNSRRAIANDIQRQQMDLRIQRDLQDQEMLRIRRISREEREQRRETIRQARIAQRHLNELQDSFRNVGFMQNFPIVRVFAFDMLRRTFTNIYQMVSQIGDKLVQWTVDSIKFNDEIRRSETFFTSLGLIGLKGAQGGQVTVAEARNSVNPQVSAAFKKSEANSRKLMIDMMAISAETGQDLQEVVGSTRQATTDLLNKLTKDGKKNPYLETPEVFNEVSNRMVRLASVLRMSDPGNRKLSFHMVGLQEFFSGSSEGKKDTGLANVMSLMRREGIKVGKDYASQITKFVNQGKLKDAMDLVEHVLTRSGLGLEQISNFMTETLQPAIDGTIMFLKMFGVVFTGSLYDTLKIFFQELVKQFSQLKKNEEFMKMISRLGIAFDKGLRPYLEKVLAIVDNIAANPEEFERKIRKAIVTFKDGVAIAFGILEAAGKFIMGFFGGQKGDGLKGLADDVKYLTDNAEKAGQNVRKFIDTIIEFRWEVLATVVALRALNAAMAGFVVYSQIAGYLTAAAAAGSTFAIRALAFFAAIRLGFATTFGFIFGIIARVWRGMLWLGRVIVVLGELFVLLARLHPVAALVVTTITTMYAIYRSYPNAIRDAISWLERMRDFFLGRRGNPNYNRENNNGAQPISNGTMPIESSSASSTIPVAKLVNPTRKNSVIAINNLTVQANNPAQFKDQMAKIAASNGVDPAFFTSIGTTA